MQQDADKFQYLSIPDLCKSIQSKLTGESLECYKKLGCEKVLLNYQRLIANRKLIDDNYENKSLHPSYLEHIAKEVADFIGNETILELKQKVEIDQDPIAMLRLADRHIHNLLPDYEQRNVCYAYDLYRQAADCGLPEACVSVSILCYLGLLPVEIRDTALPGGQPLPGSCINLPMYAKMWCYLDKGAEIGHKCPFLLTLAQNTLSQSLPIPTHVAYIYDQHIQQKLEKQTKCGYTLCTSCTSTTANTTRASTTTTDTTITTTITPPTITTTPIQLLTCSRCHSIKYCSKECQKAHYPNHKIQCKLIEKVKRLKNMPVKKGGGDSNVKEDICSTSPTDSSAINVNSNSSNSKLIS